MVEYIIFAVVAVYAFNAILGGYVFKNIFSREKEKIKPPEEPQQKVTEIERIREVVVVKPVYVSQPVRQPEMQPLPANKTFVSVIFRKRARKRYDYFLGDNFDVKVGDFVEVYVHSKISGQVEWKVAKVVYMSKPGEVSEKARSTILKKAAYDKW